MMCDVGCMMFDVGCYFWFRIQDSGFRVYGFIRVYPHYPCSTYITPLTSIFNYRANRVQTKACFQYAEVQPIIKRSLIFNLQSSIFNLPQEGGGDVGGGDEAYGGEGDDDALLTGHAGDLTLDTAEGALDDAHEVAALVMTVFGLHKQHMLIVAASGKDKIAHLSGGNDKGWVVIAVVVVEMVVIIAQEGELGGVAHVFLGFCLGEVGEEKVGNQWGQLSLDLALNLLLDVALSEVGIGTVVDQEIIGALLSAIGGSEHVPLAAWVLDIFYRHPIVCTFRNGEHIGD